MMADLGLEKTFCDICKFEFADALEYFRHKPSCLVDTTKLSVLDEKGSPAAVSISQEEDGTYACKKCNIYFSNSRSLQLHLTSKCMATKQDKVLSPNHQYQKYQFVCPNCDASFPSQVDIHHHSRHTCIANEEEFYCNLCDSGFPFMRFLRDHYDSIHAQVIKVRDPEDSTFGSEIQVERNDAGYFCCPTCDSRYKLATSFKNHLRRPCTETRGLKMCEICSRYFDGENGIIIHKYNYHHREINVKGIYLKDHEREVAFTRDDEEEFQCPSCLFKSNNSSVFKGHVLKKPCRGDIVKKASHGRKFNISTRGKSQEGHDPTHKGK